MVLALLCLPAGLRAQTWDSDAYDYGQVRLEQEEDDGTGPEIREPLFAMVLGLAEADSLGQWEGTDILEFAGATGRETNLPLENLVSFMRRRPRAQERAAWPGVRLEAVWEIELTGDLEPAMPYSILGYHPGTLRVTRHLQLAETYLGETRFSVDSENFVVRDIRIFRIQKGQVALDVDGWLDFLLGKKLDDAAVLAFLAGREPDGGRIALAVSVGREGRPIYGEFDLRQDKVLPNGRPAAMGLSRSCRGLIVQGLDDPTRHGWGKWND